MVQIYRDRWCCNSAALQPTHERSESNDNCSEDLTPAKGMKLSTEEVKAYDDFAAIDDRQAPQVVRSVQGVIRNCLQKLWIAPIAHWQTGSRLPPLSSLGVAWLFLLLHCPSQGRLSRSSFLRLDILMYNAREAFTRESEV